MPERGAGAGGRRLVAWSDFVCPFSRLAEAQLLRLVREEGVVVEHRPYELAPPGAPPLPPPDPAAWKERVAPAARALGVELRRPRLRPRTRKAHELAALARELGREADVRAVLFDAVFVDDEDIGRIDVLVRLAARLGLDAGHVKVTLDLDTWSEHVVEREREALEEGVAGTPTVRVGSTLLTGLHPWDSLLDLVRSES